AAVQVRPAGTAQDPRRCAGGRARRPRRRGTAAAVGGGVRDVQPWAAVDRGTRTRPRSGGAARRPGGGAGRVAGPARARGGHARTVLLRPTGAGDPGRRTTGDV